MSSNNVEQDIYTCCAQVNSAFYPCGGGKWVEISAWLGLLKQWLIAGEHCGMKAIVQLAGA